MFVLGECRHSVLLNTVFSVCETLYEVSIDTVYTDLVFKVVYAELKQFGLFQLGLSIMAALSSYFSCQISC